VSVILAHRRANAIFVSSGGLLFPLFISMRPRSLGVRPARRRNEVQLPMSECPLLRDVFGHVFQVRPTARTRFKIFIDTSYISVNVRYMSLGEQCSVFRFQCSVSAPADQPLARFSGKESQTDDGHGFVHLLACSPALPFRAALPTYPHRTFPDIFGHFLPGTGEETGVLPVWVAGGRASGGICGFGVVFFLLPEVRILLFSV